MNAVLPFDQAATLLPFGLRQVALAIPKTEQAVAEELRRSGSRVTISVLCPGPVPTEFDQVADVRFSIPGSDCKAVARLAGGGALPPRSSSPGPNRR